MADIKVVIQLQDTVEDEIKSLESPTAVNNASIQKTGEQLNKLSTKSNGVNLKSWAKKIYKNGEMVGSLSLADGYVGGSNTQLIEQYGYNGYVFGAVPEDKQLTVTLEILGKNIDGVIIYGDKAANQFPTKAYRDDNPNDIIYSDDPNWAIEFDEQSTSHTLTFLEWNRADYNACITYVAELKRELTLDKSWIKSVESLSQSTGQPKEVYYGVTPNRGNLEMLDINGEIKDYVQDGILEASNLPIEIYANGESPIQSYITTDSNYDTYGSTLKLDMSNDWDVILNKTYINKNITLSSNAFVLLYDVLSSMGYSDENIEYIVGEKIIVSTYDSGEQINNVITVKEYLLNIVIPYGYFENATYKETLNKFCVLAQLNMTYKNGTNLPVFVSARPVVNLSNYKVINIPKKNQFGAIEEEVFVKNKIRSANYIYKNVNFNFNNMSNPKNVIPYQVPSDYPTHRYDQSDITKRIELYKKSLTDVSVNPDITVIKEMIQDASSVADPTLNREYYSIIKFNIPEQPIYQEFEAVDSVQFFYPKGNGNADIYNQVWDISSNEIPIYDSSVSDEYITKMFLNSNGNYALGISRSSVRVRVNTSSIDVFWCFMQMITGSGVNPIVLRCWDSHSLQLKERKLVSESRKDLSSSDIDIDGGEFVQDGTLYMGEKIYSINQKNIVNDYFNGISTLKLSVSCGNYFYEDNTLAKNWDNGEMFQAGDVVTIEGNNKLWKVTGCKFRYAGVPMIDLELQEVRVVG